MQMHMALDLFLYLSICATREVLYVKIFAGNTETRKSVEADHKLKFCVYSL
jgi:hypothetical protein